MSTVDIWTYRNQTFSQRNLSGMDLTIYHITNATDIDPSCYIQFAAVIAKP